MSKADYFQAFSKDDLCYVWSDEFARTSVFRNVQSYMLDRILIYNLSANALELLNLSQTASQKCRIHFNNVLGKYIQKVKRSAFSSNPSKRALPGER